MEDIIVKIQTDIKDKYYQDNYPNDGQRFIAWYLRNIHLLDQRQAKEFLPIINFMLTKLLKG